MGGSMDSGYINLRKICVVSLLFHVMTFDDRDFRRWDRQTDEPFVEMRSRIKEAVLVHARAYVRGTLSLTPLETCIERVRGFSKVQKRGYREAGVETRVQKRGFKKSINAVGYHVRSRIGCDGYRPPLTRALSSATLPSFFSLASFLTFSLTYLSLPHLFLTDRSLFASLNSFCPLCYTNISLSH